MTWRRTREIKPGVYETQSATFHGVTQLGIAVAVLCGLVVLGMGVVALFGSDPIARNRAIGVAAVLIPLAIWHISYYRRHPEEGRRRPSPWD